MGNPLLSLSICGLRSRPSSSGCALPTSILFSWSNLKHDSAGWRKSSRDEPEGEGSFEKVKDVVATANQSREFLQEVIPFLYKHWEKAQALADAAGNALT